MSVDQASAGGMGSPPNPPGGGGGPPCWPPPCVPIDKGLGLLLIAGVILGGKKAYDLSKEKS